jgi:peptide-methionine (R)-S-oxide reductase
MKDVNPNLTKEQKEVILNCGTEAPFSGALLHEKRDGTFKCANCGQVLFDSGTKFESGSGWPSFTEPKNAENVQLLEDSSHGMVRTEVRCGNCGAHLGHVFDDGPADRGGLRYCVNSLSLSFDPDEEREKS